MAAAILLLSARPAITGSTAHRGARRGRRKALARFSLNVAISSLQITEAPPNIISRGGAVWVIAGFRCASPACRGGAISRPLY
jgi:hypothetical protein